MYGLLEKLISAIKLTMTYIFLRNNSVSKNACKILKNNLNQTDNKKIPIISVTIRVIFLSVCLLTDDCLKIISFLLCIRITNKTTTKHSITLINSTKIYTQQCLLYNFWTEKVWPTNKTKKDRIHTDKDSRDTNVVVRYCLPWRGWTRIIHLTTGSNRIWPDELKKAVDTQMLCRLSQFCGKIITMFVNVPVVRIIETRS